MDSNPYKPGSEAEIQAPADLAAPRIRSVGIHVAFALIAFALAVMVGLPGARLLVEELGWTRGRTFDIKIDGRSVSVRSVMLYSLAAAAPLGLIALASIAWAYRNHRCNRTTANAKL